jgi:hypothetical protein
MSTLALNVQRFAEMNKIRAAKLRCAQNRKNKHKKSKYQQKGTPPMQRGIDRGLALRAGGVFFPNQNFQGGNGELTRRGQEPLYLDGQPVARLGNAGAKLIRNFSVGRFWFEVRCRSAKSQEALLSLPSAQRAAFPVDGAAGTDHQIPRQVQSRLGYA